MYESIYFFSTYYYYRGTTLKSGVRPADENRAATGQWRQSIQSTPLTVLGRVPLENHSH